MLQIILSRYSSFQEVELNPIPLSMGWTLWLVSKEQQYGKEKTGSEEIWQVLCKQVIGFIIMNDIMYPDVMWWGKKFTFMVFLPKTYNPKLKIRKTLNPNWGIVYSLYNIWPSKLSRSSKTRTKTDIDQKRFKETWKSKVICYPGWDSRTEKRMLGGKIGKIQIKFGVQLKEMYLC